MAMLAVVFASCTMRSTFYGGVVVTPTEARNGDEITMKIGPFDLGPEVGVSVSTETSINGKNTVNPSIIILMGSVLHHHLMQTMNMLPLIH